VGGLGKGTTRTGRGSEGGYILLDVVVALFIIMIGFAVFLGGIGLAGSLGARQNARVHSMIEQRNILAKEHTVLFQKE
jgi:hypothetical protein